MQKYEKNFSELFPWWNGSESDFVAILEILVTLEKTNDWVGAFHDLRIMALVLGGMNAHMPLFIYTTVKMALQMRNNNWFLPYQQSYLDSFPTDMLTIRERLFLAEMSLIEQDTHTQNFSVLMAYWREVKVRCAWLPKNTAQLVRLPEVGYRKYINCSKQWETIEKESALVEEDLLLESCNKRFVKGRGFVAA